jgi:hypothetical protein
MALMRTSSYLAELLLQATLISHLLELVQM